jgi:malate synthase
VNFNPRRKKNWFTKQIPGRETRTEIDNRETSGFSWKKQKAMREAEWKSGRKIPDDLQDRRTDITGPVDRKMVVNALKFRS